MYPESHAAHTALVLQVGQLLTSQIKLQTVLSVLREYPELHAPQVEEVAQVLQAVIVQIGSHTVEDVSE